MKIFNSCQNFLGYLKKITFRDLPTTRIADMLTKIVGHCKLYDWLTASKLTLNVKRKTYFVIFSPAQRKQINQSKPMIFDNEQNKNVALECKEFVKYLGILIDNNLSYRNIILII